MDIKVSVLISMGNKTVKTLTHVDATEWCRHPEDAVKDAILKNHNIDLNSIRGDNELTVEWGDIIGRLDMDYTSTLPEELLSMESAWMTFTVTQAISTSEIAEMLAGLYERFPVLNIPAECPSCGDGSEQLMSSLIPHLNDQHLWTREQTADWLEETDYDIKFKV